MGRKGKNGLKDKGYTYIAHKISGAEKSEQDMSR